MLNAATPDFIDTLRGDLPATCFRELTPAYLEEPRGRFTGQGAALLAPETTDQVATIVRACAAANVGIVPYGGGTGLVGGQVLETGPAPVVLTLERMNAVRGVYPVENAMVVEAGVTLAEVQAAAEEQGRLFPLSLASEGTARIGGNLATNAGGVNVLRYGNARDLCLGLEAVMPDGSIWNGLSRLRKDNTGYDLRNLLIGSEGSLGIITAASLKLFPQPEQTGAGLLVVPGPEAALDLLALAGKLLGNSVSAFELIGAMGLHFLAEAMPQVRLPFDDVPDWMVLIDLGMAAGQDPQEALETLFAEAFEQGLVTDGLVAQSETQRQEFWAVRENIPAANRVIGSISSHDISLPLSAIPEFITRGGAALGKIAEMRINCFGHLGDGNLHYNVFPPAGQTRDAFDHLRGDVKACVHDLVHEMGGSVSAEHGIGRLKVKDLQKYGDPTKVALISAIKSALDPQGIMNPGVIVSA
ncbi:MAG: FAD-binding oxidoreductase [Pseudomonadota bacterium]|jgi:FAD/FMN-containing dehydrogenase|nr:FAD-binding oxidoreductase [Pseudomonadota bacterium]